MLFKICPLTMRTKGILLVRDAVFVLFRRPIDGKCRFRRFHFRPHQSLTRTSLPLGTQAGVWKQSCNQLMAILHDHSQTLLSNLQRFEGLGDKSGAGLLRGCCIVCFAHLALLCEALSTLGPVPQTGVNALCDSSLEGLGELSNVTCMEEYTRHDLLLGVHSI